MHLSFRKKILIAVQHRDAKEMRALIAELDRRKPRSVGLELREDYGTCFTKVDYFGDIHNHLRAKGVDIVLLEKPELWEETHAVQISKAMREGHFRFEEIQAHLAKVRSRLAEVGRYGAPEVCIPLRGQKRRLERFLEINAEYPTIEQLIARMKELASLRSDYDAGRVIETMPDIAVVGLSHAVEMIGRLKGYYELIAFNCKIEDAKGELVTMLGF
jgi:hypothetical protein